MGNLFYLILSYRSIVMKYIIICSILNQFSALKNHNRVTTGSVFSSQKTKHITQILTNAILPQTHGKNLKFSLNDIDGGLTEHGIYSYQIDRRSKVKNNFEQWRNNKDVVQIVTERRLINKYEENERPKRKKRDTIFPANTINQATEINSVDQCDFHLFTEKLDLVPIKTRGKLSRYLQKHLKHVDNYYSTPPNLKFPNVFNLRKRKHQSYFPDINSFNMNFSSKYTSPGLGKLDFLNREDSVLSKFSNQNNPSGDFPAAWNWKWVWNWNIGTETTECDECAKQECQLHQENKCQTCNDCITSANTCKSHNECIPPVNKCKPNNECIPPVNKCKHNNDCTVLNFNFSESCPGNNTFVINSIVSLANTSSEMLEKTHIHDKGKNVINLNYDVMSPELMYVTERTRILQTFTNNQNKALFSSDDFGKDRELKFSKNNKIKYHKWNNQYNYLNTGASARSAGSHNFEEINYRPIMTTQLTLPRIYKNSVAPPKYKIDVGIGMTRYSKRKPHR